MIKVKGYVNRKVMEPFKKIFNLEEGTIHLVHKVMMHKMIGQVIIILVIIIEEIVQEKIQKEEEKKEERRETGTIIGHPIIKIDLDLMIEMIVKTKDRTLIIEIIIGKADSAMLQVFLKSNKNNQKKLKQIKK